MAKRPPATKKQKAKALKASRGYTFKKSGRKGFALMRQNNDTGATFSCDCDLSGGCKVVIDPTDASSISCLNSGCSGDCGWVVKLAGIRGLAFVARAD